MKKVPKAIRYIVRGVMLNLLSVEYRTHSKYSIYTNFENSTLTLTLLLQNYLDDAQFKNFSLFLQSE